jgi:hypothetical protein
MTPTARQRFGWLPSALTIVMLFFLLATTWLWYAYAYTRPSTPNATTGRVYAHNTHGTVVYLTLGEEFRLIALECGGILSMAGAMLSARAKRNVI